MRTGDDVYCPVCATEAVIAGLWDGDGQCWVPEATHARPVMQLMGVALSCWCQFFSGDGWSIARVDDGVWRLSLFPHPPLVYGAADIGRCPAKDCRALLCGHQGQRCPGCDMDVPWGVCPHCRQVTVMRPATLPLARHPGAVALMGWSPDCCSQLLPHAQALSSGWMPDPDAVTGRPPPMRRVQHLGVFGVRREPTGPVVNRDGPVYLDGGA